MKSFDIQIKHWCQRQLSLGGRLILAKLVLENLAVYWLSLSKIPRSILDAIRKKFFVFLWFDSQVQAKYHLAKWEIIVWPKDKGGWALKNIFKFSLALRAKRIWLTIFGDSLWSKVLKEKYYRKLTLVQWIWSGKKFEKGGFKYLELYPQCL